MDQESVPSAGDKKIRAIFENLLEFKARFDRIREEERTSPENIEIARIYFEAWAGLSAEEVNSLSRLESESTGEDVKSIYSRIIQMRNLSRKALGKDNFGRRFVRTVRALEKKTRTQNDYLMNIDQPYGYNDDSKFIDFMREMERSISPPDEDNITRGEN